MSRLAMTPSEKSGPDRAGAPAREPAVTTMLIGLAWLIGILGGMVAFFTFLDSIALAAALLTGTLTSAGVLGALGSITRELNQIREDLATRGL